MKNRVYNGTFGKIVRTLGYLLVLAGSAFFLAKILVDPAHVDLPFVGSLTQYGQMIDDQLVNVAFLDSGYALIAVVLGFILLTFALRRGVIVKVILTAALLIGLLLTANEGGGLFAPLAITFATAVADILAFSDVVLDPLLGISPFVAPGVYALSAFFLWVVFAYKRPRRLSTFFMRIGATTLFLGMAMLAVPEIVSAALLDNELYVTAAISLYTISYATFVLGSVFGVIGFLRK